MTLYKIQCLMICVILLMGCEKLVEVDPPQDQLISSTIFETDETAISAITGLYASMMKNDYPMSYNLSLFTGLYGDELEYNQSVTSLVSLYKYALLAKDAPTNTFWSNSFNYIYQANVIIEGLNKSSAITQAVKNQLLGEALFVRSFWNYYLSLLYGDIPLLLSTDYLKTSELGKSSIQVVREQIVKDLEISKNLLGKKYVTANSISESMDRIRPNTFVASALLARVYLQMKQYNKAEAEATIIISDGKYVLSDIAAVFKRTSKEVIWQLELPTNTNLSNSYEARMYTLTAKPSPNSIQRCATIGSSLLSLFDIKDKRRTAWVGTYIDNTVTPSMKYNYPSKYKTTSAPADEYTTPLRLAEIYLIRAEARAELDLINDAITDTDRIRFRAGLDLLKDINPNITKQALLDSISIERRRELFCEWGSRWADIKRSTIADELLKIIAAQKSASWKSSSILWPIPLNDVLNSGNKIEQNEGYN